MLQHWAPPTVSTLYTHSPKSVVVMCRISVFCDRKLAWKSHSEQCVLVFRTGGTICFFRWSGTESHLFFFKSSESTTHHGVCSGFTGIWIYYHGRRQVHVLPTAVVERGGTVCIGPRFDSPCANLFYESNTFESVFKMTRTILTEKIWISQLTI